MEKNELHVSYLKDVYMFIPKWRFYDIQNKTKIIFTRLIDTLSEILIYIKFPIISSHGCLWPTALFDWQLFDKEILS